jgi:hypothetical protein
MNEYRRRLERTQIKFCFLLILLLFIGLLILPHIGQIVWIAIIAAIYIRVALVIARREELLEEQGAAREDNPRLHWAANSAPYFSVWGPVGANMPCAAEQAVSRS